MNQCKAFRFEILECETCKNVKLLDIVGWGNRNGGVGIIKSDNIIIKNYDYIDNVESTKGGP